MALIKAQHALLEAEWQTAATIALHLVFWTCCPA